MARCWTVGRRPRATYRLPKPSSDELSHASCTPEHIVTDKATFYPSAINAWAPDAKHTATGFYNRVISTNRCERNHGYIKSRLRPMRGLKSFERAKRLFRAPDAWQLIVPGYVASVCTGVPRAGGRSYMRAYKIADVVTELGRGL